LGNRLRKKTLKHALRLARFTEHRYIPWRLKVIYPDLPVSRRREEILDAMRASQVVVVVGETGSGKTTQLPKMAVELAREM